MCCDIPAAHDGAQGLSLQCPATAPTEGVAVQGHCKQVCLHGSRGGVFVGHRPPRDPGGPLQKIEVLHLFRWYTHTHTYIYILHMIIHDICLSMVQDSKTPRPTPRSHDTTPRHWASRPKDHTVIRPSPAPLTQKRPATSRPRA